MMESDEESSSTPSPAPSRDDPSEGEPRRTLAVRNKGKAPATLETGRRKRGLDSGEQPTSSRRRTREPSPESDVGDTEDYDPDQPMEERRRIQRSMREMQRAMQDNPDEYLRQDSTALVDYLKKANDLLAEVKQTSEAAIDSRGLLIAAELASKRTQTLTAGNAANGVDVDEFVSKCITYMLQGSGIADDLGPGLSGTQIQRRQRARGSIAENEEVGDEGDMMNWEHLGRYACLPNIRRPAVSGFLLGPLSVVKKARKPINRTARLKINSLKEVRPQVLQAEDLARNEKNDLTIICSKILHQLQTVQSRAQDIVERKVNEAELSDEEVQQLMEENCLRSTGGIDLLRFIVNPRSFGQTVENMFYVSFLVRDGRIKIDFDENGLPALEPVDRDVLEDSSTARQQGSMKHQAIMAMDMATWRDVISAFDITDPIIPHRDENHLRASGVRGWYS